MVVATETRTLEARFDGDVKGLAAAVKKAERQLGKYDKSAQESTKKTGAFGRTIATVGSGGAKARIGLQGAAKAGGIAAVAIGATIGVAQSAGQAFVDMSASASNLSLGVAKARGVFGASFPAMEAWARSSAEAMGLTRLEALGLGANIQDFLVPMGVARDQAAKMSLQLLDLSGTLALNSGGTRTAAEVADIFTAAMAGEYDSLQSLGIGISAARVEQVKADLVKKSSKKLTDAEATALAVLKIAQADSTDATKLATTAEGRQAQAMLRTRAQLRGAWQDIQLKLLPVLLRLWGTIDQKVVPAVQKFVVWLDSPQGQQAMREWADKISRIVSQVGSLIGQLDRAVYWVNKFSSAASRVNPINIGAIGSAVSGIRNLFGRAHGGPVSAGEQYVVGERGPEVLTMGSRSGHITPNHEAGGGDMVAEIHIEIGGEVVRVIRQEIRTDKRKLKRTVTAGAAA